MKGLDVKRANWLSLVFVLSFGAMQSAWTAPDAALQPCQDDAQKFCAKVKPGKGRMSQCLKGHEADLSQECETHLETMREHMLEAREACSDDAKMFCADSKPGHGRIVACLKNHESELSDACKEEMKK
jgi:hypothetical protein